MGVKRSIDHGQDDHPAGDEDEDHAPVAWALAVTDDCDACADLRVELLFEEVGSRSIGLTAHLSPATARRLRVALANALKELGEEP